MKLKDKEKLNNPLKGWQILSSISSMVFHTVHCAFFSLYILSYLYVCFVWPFFYVGNLHWIFVVAIAASAFLLISEVGIGSIDAKSIALLGVMSAFITLLRPLGAGAAGLEPIWFALIIAARVFGPSWGFLLGITSMTTSALLTGGVGPWLPYQVFAAGWIGLLAGALPHQGRCGADRCHPPT